MAFIKVKFIWWIVPLGLATFLSLFSVLKNSSPPIFQRTHYHDLTLSSIQENSTKEGERIVTTICNRCHYNPDTGTLSGRKHPNPERVGDFWSGNITRDTLHGIGSWSRKDLVYFLKYGVTPDGRYVFDMPKYIHLSDSDMSSLVSFLKSDHQLVKATPISPPDANFSLPMKLLMAVWLRPPSWVPSEVEHPDTSNKIAFGRYLVVAKFACFDCHSGNSMTNNHLYPESSWRFFKGGNPHANHLGEKVLSPDLTSSGRAMTEWSEDEFVNCLRTGTRPDGTILQDPMFPFSMLTENEASSIYQYLKTL